MNKKLLTLFFLLACVFIIYSSTFYTDNESNNAKLKGSNSTLNWSEKIIGYDEVEYKDPVKIAILDSGINKGHSALKGTKFQEYNAITRKNEKINDDYGHGTAIAGIIAARGEKTKGVIANPIIYDVKVLNENGEGKIESVVEGINWSIEKDVDIINISFGFTSDREDLKNTIDKAIEKGIIIVAASGNTMGLSVDYPAKYDQVLSIASLDKDLNIDTYSATGKIDYSAPGIDIISTDKDGRYSSFSGTSFACAYATGVIASILMKEDIELNHELSDKVDKYIVALEDQEKYGKGLLTLNKELLEESK